VLISWFFVLVLTMMNSGYSGPLAMSSLGNSSIQGP
jgi:hypothetical protein